MEFPKVMESVRMWFKSAQERCSQKTCAEIVSDSDGVFRVFFESGGKMGELIVTQPDFAPYRFVSFQILRTDETPVFCYFDSDSSSVREILENLDAGLQML